MTYGKYVATGIEAIITAALVAFTFPLAVLGWCVKRVGNRSDEYAKLSRSACWARYREN